VSGTAVFEADYLVSGADTFTETEVTVTIPANQLATTIIITPIPDFTPEPDKTIVLTLAPTLGISVLGENPVAIATILDDDVAGASNDNLADRIIISPAATSVTGDMTGATLEVGEQNPGSFSGFSQSLWWEVTFPVSKGVTIDTFDSALDNGVVVYTGDATDVSTLTPMAWRGSYWLGENPNSEYSILYFEAVADTTYYIQVLGEVDTDGAIIMAIGEYDP
jgi:hypothetical protein